jgi:hypothetical protein
VVHAQAPQAISGDAERLRIEQQLQELRGLRNDLMRTMQDFDARIEALETEIEARSRAMPAPAPPAPAAQEIATQAPALAAGGDNPYAPTASAVPPPVIASAPQSEGGALWGTYEPGKGFVLVRSPTGELSVTLISYLRYLNQLALDPTYTDTFGRTSVLDRRQDVQLNKINLTFKGWIFDPDFQYRAWIWTQNPAMGLGAQVVVAGHLGYTFADYFTLLGGVAPLPSNRTTNWTYPFWLKMDNRTVADEFFRASYTFGFWAEGKLADGLLYRAMIANNLSALGVDAGQLDPDFSTMSAALWWMPTTGEYGVAEGIGDYDYHENLATRFGLHYTRSREDSQSQPDQDDFENSQIRLSDGTRIFQAGAFATDGQIRKATYQMTAANAGLKYRGFSLEGEYFVRWVDDFQTIGFIPVTELFDHGFQVQTSAMVVRDRLQLYAAGSQVFGEYGEPWDVTLGFNFYPFARREMRWNLQGIYMRNSPVGGTSYPYIVGANGWIFNTDFILTF